MMQNSSQQKTAQDLEAVITSFNQGEMIREAVQSLCSQTVLPGKIILVDDGSSEEKSLTVLKQIEKDRTLPVRVEILRQANGGVSAARNAGILRTQTPLVLILDGDDRLKPCYIETVAGMLRADPELTAASSWMQTFGVLDSEVRPAGGDVTAFLSRNCCPATHMFRRKIWEACGGYDESMRSGFEDWDFFLSMLEAAPGSRIGIAQEALIEYRTNPASSNIRSMEKRLELMRYLIVKHQGIYQKYLAEAILGVESISMSRLFGWESEICRARAGGSGLSREAEEFLRHPSYGDGGMAAAVRIVSETGGK